MTHDHTGTRATTINRYEFWSLRLLTLFTFLATEVATSGDAINAQENRNYIETIKLITIDFKLIQNNSKQRSFKSSWKTFMPGFQHFLASWLCSETLDDRHTYAQISHLDFDGSKANNRMVFWIHNHVGEELEIDKWHRMSALTLCYSNNLIAYEPLGFHTPITSSLHNFRIVIFETYLPIKSIKLHKWFLLISIRCYVKWAIQSSIACQVCPFHDIFSTINTSAMQTENIHEVSQISWFIVFRKAEWKLCGHLEATVEIPTEDELVSIQ